MPSILSPVTFSTSLTFKYMKPKITLIFLSLFAAFVLHAQTDTLNQYDVNGEKHGTWVVYLDANWTKITDSAVACYTRYAVYIHGGNLYPMAQWGKKGYTLKRNGEVVTCVPGKVVMLDGEYKWYNAKGHLLSTHILKNGIYTYYEYYTSSGTVRGKYAYTEQCGETPLDYCLYIYDKKGNLKVKGPIPRDSTGKPINKE